MGKDVLQNVSIRRVNEWTGGWGREEGKDFRFCDESLRKYHSRNSTSDRSNTECIATNRFVVLSVGWTIYGMNSRYISSEPMFGRDNDLKGLEPNSKFNKGVSRTNG